MSLGLRDGFQFRIHFILPTRRLRADLLLQTRIVYHHVTLKTSSLHHLRAHPCSPFTNVHAWTLQFALWTW